MTKLIPDNPSVTLRVPFSVAEEISPCAQAGFPCAVFQK